MVAEGIGGQTSGAVARRRWASLLVPYNSKEVYISLLHTLLHIQTTLDQIYIC